MNNAPKETSMAINLGGDAGRVTMQSVNQAVNTS
ncbi:type III secretion protein [Bordetella pertussis]|nr:type III secretion protein [Bordetella pertussis]